VQLSRRRAIQLASMSALATAAGSAFAAQASKVFSDQNLALYDNMSAAVFQPWVDTEFVLSGPTGASDKLLLKSVRDLATLAPAASGTTEQVKGTLPAPHVTGFMLSFQGTGKALPQSTYILTNIGLGSFSAFLVPAGSGQPKYTAVFASAPQGA